jgi:hypothetical protein
MVVLTSALRDRKAATRAFYSASSSHRRAEGGGNSGRTARKIMHEIEKLQGDIDTLKESIKLNRMNLDQRTQEELRGILQHTALCMTELESLKMDLKRLTNSN